MQPATIKTHNIIERTASFVCQQGAQFEIVLKAKQAANSQFDFLRFDHYLNPYYKHVLRAMKEGRYSVTPPAGAPGGGDDQQGKRVSERESVHWEKIGKILSFTLFNQSILPLSRSPDSPVPSLSSSRLQ